MRSFPRFLLTPFLFAAALAGAALFAQTVTGSLAGRVLDAEGRPVAGAEVVVTGPAIQGERRAVTDSSGHYTVPHLPPSEEYTLAVFTGAAARVELRRRSVQAETITAQDVHLSSEGQAVEVVSGAPMVATRQAVVPVHWTEQEVKSLPILGEFADRSFQSLLYFSPTATHSRQAGNPAISGGTAVENVYLIDGITTNDPVTGTWGTGLNVNFLRAVETESCGFEAQDASSTGGFFSLITRSGSNDFHGDLCAWVTTSGMTANRKADAFGASENNNYSAQDWGATLSGPLVKGRLWFFAGINPYRKTEELRGTSTVRNTLNGALLDLDRNYDNRTATLGYLGKLTWRVSPSHLLELTVFGDPSDQKLHEGAPVTLYDAARESRRSVGSTNAGLRWYASASPRLFFDIHVAYTRLTNNLRPKHDSPADYATRAVVSLDWNPELAVSPGFGGFTLDTRETRQLGLKATWLPPEGHGHHEVTFGGEYDAASWDRYADYTGGALVQVKTQTGADVTSPASYRYNYLYYAGNPNFHETGYYAALFGQDRWTLPGNRVTLTFGLRAERNALQSGGGNDLTLDSLSPRLALAWDFTGEGRGKLFASAGRYYERVPLYLAQSLDANHPTYKDTYDTGVLTARTVFSKNPAFALGGVQNQSQDEFMLGVQYEAAPDFALTARLLYRDLNRLLETVGYVNAAGGIDYIVMNPGAQTTPLLDTWAGRIPDYAPFPKPRRTYEALELLAQKRFTRNWFFEANYTLSRLEGNTAAGFDSTGTELAPNASTEWDIPSAAWIANRDGLLPTDRLHQIKATAAYRFPRGFLVGANVRFDSGRPVNKLADWPKNEFGYGKLYVAPRSSAGRTASQFTLGLHGEYGHKLGRGDLTLFVDVLNVFNTQAQFRVDETYYNKRNTWAQAPVVSATWGWTKKYYDPRAVGLGVKWSF